MTNNKANGRQDMSGKDTSADPTYGVQDFETAFREGTTLLHQGRAAESVPHLERAFALRTGDTDAGINLGGAYIMTKNFKKGVAILEPLSREEPDHAKIWINLGAAYLGNPVLARDSDQEKAISAFERALEIDPVAPSVAYNIGLIYRDRRENDKAIFWFKQAVKQNPRDKDARSLLRRLEAG